MASLLIPTLLLAAASPLLLPQSQDAKAQFQRRAHRSSIQRKNKPATASKRPQARRNPREITSSIEKAVHEEFLSPTRERLEYLNLEVDKNNKSLSVVSSGPSLYLDPSDPHMLPFNAQYNAEYLTGFFLESDIPARQWRPRLAAFKNEIYQTVVVLESTKDRAKLLKNLEQRAITLNGLLEGFKDFIVNFYKAKGYEISFPFGGALSIPVPVVTAPAGGTIKVMKYLNYRKCLVFGLQRSVWPWLTLNQDKMPLIGRYRYFVSWPDGKTAEGDIRIVSGDPVVFRPAQ